MAAKSPRETDLDELWGKWEKRMQALFQSLSEELENTLQAKIDEPRTLGEARSLPEDPVSPSITAHASLDAFLGRWEERMQALFHSLKEKGLTSLAPKIEERTVGADRALAPEPAGPPLSKPEIEAVTRQEDLPAFLARCEERMQAVLCQSLKERGITPPASKNAAPIPGEDRARPQDPAGPAATRLESGEITRQEQLDEFMRKWGTGVQTLFQSLSKDWQNILQNQQTEDRVIRDDRFLRRDRVSLPINKRGPEALARKLESPLPERQEPPPAPKGEKRSTWRDRWWRKGPSGLFAPGPEKATVTHRLERVRWETDVSEKLARVHTYSFWTIIMAIIFLPILWYLIMNFSTAFKIRPLHQLQVADPPTMMQKGAGPPHPGLKAKNDNLASKVKPAKPVEAASSPF